MAKISRKVATKIASFKKCVKHSTKVVTENFTENE